MRIIGEACLKLENAEAAINLAFESLQSHCIRRSRQGIDYALDFLSAKVFVRPERDILWVRVEADELAICHGTKMLIETEIRRHANSMPTYVLWLEAHGEPFATIMAFEKAGGTTEC